MRGAAMRARPLRCPLEHVTDSALSQAPAALMRGKERIIGPGIAAQGEQRGAHDSGSKTWRVLPPLPVTES